MKKMMFAATCGVMAVFCGCTTVESTQVFNKMGLGTPEEKAVCQTHVEIPGYFFFGLPIVTGSPAGDGEWSLFRYNLTTENAVYLLTKEAKARKAARVVNVQVTKDVTYVFPPFITRQSVQASGTGVRTRSAAIERAASDYDNQF